MRNSIAHRTTFALLAMCAIAGAAGAAAQVQRTFVASTGDDANPCTFAQPCRSFATALTQTSSGGEIIVVDSAGYGKVAIAQSVSIIAAPGIYAGISVFPGESGVVISGVGSRVRLSGLTINGLGGDIGIQFQQGAKLAVDHCSMTDLNLYGVYVQAPNSTWIVTDTTVSGNALYGIIAEAGTGTLDRVRVENNFGIGVLINTSSNVLVRASIRDSVVAGNAGNGVSVFTGSGRTAIVVVDNSSAFANAGSGFAGTTSGGTTLLTLRSVVASANTGSGAIASGIGATVVVTASALSRNVNFGMEQAAGSILRSLVDNTVEDNVAGATSGSITNSMRI